MDIARQNIADERLAQIPPIISNYESGFFSITKVAMCFIVLLQTTRSRIIAVITSAPHEENLELDSEACPNSNIRSESKQVHTIEDDVPTAASYVCRNQGLLKRGLFTYCSPVQGKA